MRSGLGVLLGCFLVASVAEAQGVRLRPIDHATVRVMSIAGVQAHAVEGSRTRQRRVVALPVTSHGSGVAVSPDLVLTARHVVTGADAWAVVAPGESTPLVARPVYVDEDHDFAFLRVDGRLDHHVPLAAPRALTLNESVSVSGYPLDLREPTPGAASGEVSRVTRNGELHLTMSVNPGHSGGPVVDHEGRLIGIVSARGRPERGVEGLVIAIPLGVIHERRDRVPPERPAFRAWDRDLVTAMGWLAGLGSEALLDRGAVVTDLIERAEAWPARDADRDAVIAALAWNLLIEVLEHHRAPTLVHVPAAARPAAGRLLERARTLASRSLDTGPHVRRRFPVLRAISLGRPLPPAPESPDL